MNKIEVLTEIRRKIDILTELVDSSGEFEPRGISAGGKYTAEYSCFYQPGWTYSFLMGMVGYLYWYTHEEKYLRFLEKAKTAYTRFLWGNTAEIGHDSGFLYSLYAVMMYRLTGENVYRELALKAADEVGKRYQFEARHVQSFYDMRLRGITDSVSMLIADDMMNQCLLMWAYGETGHSFYRSVFTNHIQTTVNYLIRDDFSVRHAYHFETKTGKPIGETNICGYAVGSHWSRGTAWIIYGLTKALRFTGEKEKYLALLEGITQKFLQELGNDAVPKWDFRIPGNEPVWYDSSAAAICASAFSEFGLIGVSEKLSERCAKKAEQIFSALAEAPFFGTPEKEYLLCYQNGEGCLWGDYFFCELTMKLLHGKETIDFWI